MKRSLFLIICLSFYFCKAHSQNTLGYTENEVHFNNGIELFEKKAYSAARKEFKTYVEASEKTISPNQFNIANAEYYAAVCALYTNAKDADIEVHRFVLNHSEHPKAKIIYADLGNSFYEKGDYAKAIEYLKMGVDYRADNLEIYELRYKLGVSYYQLKDYRNALVEFDFVKNTAAEHAINAAYYAAVINFQNENYDAALVDLKRVENVNPYKLEVPNWIAQILYKQEKYDELTAYAEPIISNPDGRKIDELCLMTAEVFYFKNNYEKAAMYYERLAELRRTKLDPQVTFRHGYSLYKIENYPRAISVLKTIADRDDELGQQAAYYLGISALKTNDLIAAQAAFDFARKSDFDVDIKEDAYFNYIKLLIDQGKNENAVSAIKEYVKTNPNGKYIDQSNELLSDVLYQTNDYIQAINYIESLSRTTTKIDAAYQKLCYSQAVLMFNDERFGDAKIYFEKSLKKPIDNDLVQRAKFWRAETAYAMNDPEAENLYKEVLRSGTAEQKTKSYYSLGYLRYNVRDFDNALTYFNDFLKFSINEESQQSREDALLRVADCYLIKRDFNTALRNYEKAYAQNRTDKDYALFQKGITLDLLGRKAEAASTFDTFSKTYNNSRLIDDALYEKGNLELEKREYIDAISSFSEMLSKRPKSNLVPNALLKRALAYSNVENYDKSIADYKTIIERFGNHETANEALIGLRDVMNLTGRSEDFADVADEYQKNNPGSNSAIALQYEAAKNLYYTEKYESAITSLRRFIQSNPNNSNVIEARYLIAESYYFTNQPDKALPYFDEVIEDGKSGYVTTSAFRSGDINFNAKNYREAVSGYQNVLSSSESKRDQVAAWEGLFMAYYYLGDTENTLKYANEAIQNGGGLVVGIENKAELFKGKAYMKQKNYTAAKSQFEKVIGMDKDINGAEAKYQLGYMLYDAGKYEESIKEMQQLAEDFSDFVTWYESAFMLIADNYIAMKDNFMAKATLNSIIDNSGNPETVATAKAKLKTIKD